MVDNLVPSAGPSFTDLLGLRVMMVMIFDEGEASEVADEYDRHESDKDEDADGDDDVGDVDDDDGDDDDDDDDDDDGE